MRRRQVLAWVAAAGVGGAAGCAGSLPAPLGPTPDAEERCADKKVPERHLGVIRLEPADPPPEPGRVIHFGDLPADEQAIVTQAVERDRYAICLPEASADRVAAFNNLVERIQDHSAGVTDGAYLERDGTYYRFTHARAGDQVWVTATA